MTAACERKSRAAHLGWLVGNTPMLAIECQRRRQRRVIHANFRRREVPPLPPFALMHDPTRSRNHKGAMLRTLARSDVRKHRSLTVAARWGALDSPQVIFHADATEFFPAPRQSGKTSLLIRYLSRCKLLGKRAALIDFQVFTLVGRCRSRPRQRQPSVRTVPWRPRADTGPRPGGHQRFGAGTPAPGFLPGRGQSSFFSARDPHGP